MGYIPKKMTNNNLYTAGNQFVDQATGNTYTGSYHELFDGTTFSGKTPNDPNSRKLLVDSKSISQTTKVITSNENLRYQQLNPSNQELYKYGKDPIAFIPQPTGNDYQRGSIQRYFTRKRNEIPTRILEIDLNTYNDLDIQGGEYNYAMWDVTKIYWKISGPLTDTRDRSGIIIAGIADTNQRLVDYTNKEFKGIKQYLSNLIQFAVRPKLELVSNLYSGGGDFTYKADNNGFSGYYHLMADGTIMDGAIHEQSQGKILLAGDVIVQGQVNTLINKALGNLGAISTQPIQQQQQQQQQPQESVDPPSQISTFTSPTTGGGY